VDEYLLEGILPSLRWRRSEKHYASLLRLVEIAASTFPAFPLEISFEGQRYIGLALINPEISEKVY